MEASLLAAPKPSIFSARGPAARRCLVVAAAGARKVRDFSNVESQEVGRDDDVLVQRVKAVAAAAMIGGETEPCHAASLQAVAVVLDPATAKAVAAVAGPALSALGFLFILRIVMSWYPRLPVTEFPYVLAYAPTEPFLAVTRRIIPPLGGVDVTPVVWFGLVSFLNEILVGPQGLLVLLAQQQHL